MYTIHTFEWLNSRDFILIIIVYKFKQKHANMHVNKCVSNEEFKKAVNAESLGWGRCIAAPPLETRGVFRIYKVKVVLIELFRNLTNPDLETRRPAAGENFC